MIGLRGKRSSNQPPVVRRVSYGVGIRSGHASAIPRTARDRRQVFLFTEKPRIAGQKWQLSP